MFQPLTLIRRSSNKRQIVLAKKTKNNKLILFFYPFVTVLTLILILYFLNQFTEEDRRMNILMDKVQKYCQKMNIEGRLNTRKREKLFEFIDKKERKKAIACFISLLLLWIPSYYLITHISQLKQYLIKTIQPKRFKTKKELLYSFSSNKFSNLLFFFSINLNRFCRPS